MLVQDHLYIVHWRNRDKIPIMWEYIQILSTQHPNKMSMT